MRALILSLLILPTLAGAQAYRCTSDGTVTYADRPCGPDAEPITIERHAGDPLAGARRLNDARETLREIRISNNLADVEREIRRSRALIDRYERARSQRLAQLRVERSRNAERTSRRFNDSSLAIATAAGLDNVANATRDVSMAEEMQAVNQRYDSLIQQQRAELELRFRERLILLGE